MRRRLGTGAALLAIAAVVVVLLATTDGDDEHPSVRDRPDRRPAPAERLADAPLPSRGPGDSIVPPDRVAVVPDARAAWTGRVRDAAGRPLAGAEVSWSTAWRGGSLAEATGDAAWADALGRTRHAATDEDGVFRFEAAPDGPLEASVVWATLPGKRPALRVLADGGWPAALELVLEDAPPLDVVVRRADGSPVADAAVRQLALPSDDTPGALLRRAARTDAAGRSRLACPDGAQVLLAVAGDHRSLPRRWSGCEASVELVVGSAFEVAGTVAVPPVAEGADLEPLRVRLRARTGNVWREVVELPASERWGPVSLARGDADGYAARLEGGGVVPTEVAFEAPPPGGRVELALVAEPGCSQWFSVTDPDERPVPGATLTVWWEDESGGVVERRVPVDEQGYAQVHGLPRGLVRAWADAPGHASARLAPRWVPDEERALWLRLVPGGALHGRCTLDGAPVADFQVVHWPHGSAELQRVHTFTGRADGTFTLEGLPLGPVALVAASPRAPGSPPVVVEVAADDAAEVELALLPSRRGSGRVVDAESGAPLADAWVQLHVSGDLEPVAPWGPRRPVAADGSFDLDGFRAGRNHVGVGAPGYGDVLRVVDAAPAGEIDLGVVELHRRSPLEVALVGPSGVDPAGHVVEVSGPESFDARPFVLAEPGRAVAELPDVGPGVYWIDVRRPDGSRERFAIRVAAGVGSEVEVPAATGHRVLVAVDEASPLPLPAGANARVTYRAEDGSVRERYTPFAEDGTARFDAMPDVAFQLEVATSAWESLATVRSAVGGAGERLVRVVLSDEPLVLRVVDGEGRPLAGAFVRLRDPSHPPDAWLSGTTADDGTCRLGGIPEGSYLVHVEHATAGVRLGLPLADAPRGRDDVVEVVVDGAASIELLLRDGETPLAGVACAAVDPSGAQLLAPVHSSAEGVVRLERLSPGPLRLLLRHPDVWAREIESTAAPDAAPTPVDLRRTGDLDVEVRDATGLPVGDIAVRLVDVGTGESVDAWADQGRLAVDERGVRTDARGLLALRGLPHGDYHVSVDLPDGSSASATVRVLPGERRRVLLVPT